MAFSTSVRAFLVSVCVFAVQSEAGALVQPRDAVPSGYVALPYYPAPHGGWTSDWSASYDKAKVLVEQMTLAEKTNITAGTGIYMGKTP